MNEILQAMQTKGMKRGAKSKRWSKYSDLKREYESLIISAINLAKIKPVKRAYFMFSWIEKSRKRDPDNIAAGGRKFIFDSLVTAGVLENDGWKQIAGWNDTFMVKEGNQQPGVGVTIWANK
jgi:hypothetical protein